jgi:outer membrane immunogenic protein
VENDGVQLFKTNPFGGSVMSKITIGFATIAVLIGTAAAASAQSTETQSTDDILRRLQAIEASNAALAKENAALREENTKLRGRVSEIKASNQTATPQQTSATSASALNHSNSKLALYDKASSPMVVKAPPSAPVPVYSWTGWYVGGNVGYGWGGSKTDNAVTGTVNFVGPTPFPSSFVFSDSNKAHLNGVIGGGQLGYNYQFSSDFILGLEADIQDSDQRGSNTFVQPLPVLVCSGSAGPPDHCTNITTFNGTAVTNYDAKIDWFGTVRGRVGYLITPQLLLYETGGLAYGRVEVSGNAVLTRPQGPGIQTFGIDSFSTSKTNVGFSVGGGIEGSVWLPANWTWKLEYLYLDLGSLDVMTPLTSRSGIFSSGTTTMQTHFTDNILRGGLNYQFH